MDALVLRSVRILGLASQNVQSGTTDYRNVVAREIVRGQQLTDLHLNQVEQLLVVYLISLVHEDNDIRNAYLTGQQDVLAGLRHRAVSSGYNQDSTVHLSSAGDHVLNVVGMARAVNVSVVTLSGVILNVCGVDGNAALLLLRSLVDCVVCLILSIALESQNLGDCSGQSGLAVVNVADGANVNVRQRTVKFFLCHCGYPPRKMN